MKRNFLEKLLIVACLFLPACGKHETTGGAVGATAGAIIGSSMSSKKDKTTAAFLGGIIGNIVGASAGRSADEEEAQDRYYKKKMAERSRKIAQKIAHEQRLQANLERWCMTCHSQNSIPGALRCPSCGDALVKEKLCRGCWTAFGPTSSYRFCPFCSERRLLVYR